MEEVKEDYGQWWLVEPPKYDLEPEETDDPELSWEERSGPESRYLDGTQSHPLFKDVRITEEAGVLSFVVPGRILDTPSEGKWELEVSGRRRWFKEHDDYGQIRFLASGAAIWVPHLFPFEETDEKGLPLIRERERCEVTVSMEPLQQEDLVFTARLETQYGVLTAPQAPESYNPNFISFFTEFEFSGRPLISDVVTFPERRWNFFDDFLKDKGITLTNGEYRDIRLGKTPFPEGEEYFAQDNPHDWQEREPSGYQGPAFGSIWVPIDGLRYGIEANISFPEFSEEKAE